MAADPWGIDVAYNGGHWGRPLPETRKALLAAMGVDDPEAVPPAEEAVRVVRHGTTVPGVGSGELQLEDGSRLTVDGQLPGDLPLGYHQLQHQDRPEKTWIIVTPATCVPPPQRVWGWVAQLYAARSPQSWGMGDLADLRELSRWSAELGAGLLLVNPLYAASPVLPQESSPYYPVSRRFLNPLYLRIEEVPGAAECGAPLDELAAAGRALNAQPHIDRHSVFRHKQQALKLLWSRRPADDAFDRFCRERGAELEQFAVYCALAELFGGDWRQWPTEYHTPEGPAVQAATQERADDVRFHQWLQWLLDRQLARAAEPLPLVHDLPIGVHPGGADAWIWQDLLAKNCTVGAPPDVFNNRGQNWDLPAFVPHKLRNAGYRPLVETLRAALRHCGGLRIDHVMGLFRLFWIPQGLDPAAGAYVRYWADEMLGIVALESRRAGAFIVGEDLGNVEDSMRRDLAAHHVLSYRVLWFEERPPAEYPQWAMAAVTTHDLPTIAGLWSGHDLEAQERISPHPNDAISAIRRRFGELLAAPADTPLPEVIEKTHQLLAQAPARILVATLEDALAVRERPNMPGTTTQWPNWCIALPGGLTALAAADLPRRIAQALHRPLHKAP